MQYKIDIERKVNTEVLVAGGGIAGTAAAVSAARAGAKTMLIEESGCLGGQATLGIVTPIGSICTLNNKSFGGLTEEICKKVSENAKKYSAPVGEEEDLTAAPHILKYVLLEMAIDAGVEIRFHTSLIDAIVSGGEIQKVITHDRSGFAEISAKVFIDGTGDGALIYHSGAEYSLGSEPGVFEEVIKNNMDYRHFSDEKYTAYETDGLMQPVSIFFTMGNVDMEKAYSYNNKLYKFGDFGISKNDFQNWKFCGTCGFEISDDRLPMPQGRILVSHGPNKGCAVINMSRVTGIDGTDADSLNQGEISAQKQVIAIVDFLKTFIPGFENSYFIQSANTLGIRETRRLNGAYKLSGSEVINGAKNADAIARGSYIIDIHDPKGKSMAIGGDIKGDFYDIPYGCLVSRQIDNLAVCGRCVSVDHVAHSSVRVQGTCIMTGQAAGAAAAMAAAENISVCEIDVKQLQKRLISDGVYLD